MGKTALEDDTATQDQVTFGTRISFIPLNIVHGFFKGSFVATGLVAFMTYFRELLTYLRDGVAESSTRQHFFSLDLTELTGWVGLDILIREVIIFAWSPDFFLFYALMGWLTFQAYQEQLSGSRYKNLSVLQQFAIDTWTFTCGLGWFFVILMSFIGWK